MKEILIPTHQVSTFYFVSQPYRSDLNFFASSNDQLREGLNKYPGNYPPVVYLIEFWKTKPSFKKLTKKELDSILSFSESTTKKKSLSEGKILNATQMRQFKKWIKDGNATEVQPNVWLEQSTQYSKKFDYDALQKFFKREYL